MAGGGPRSWHLAAIGALSAALILGLFVLAKWIRETSDWPTEKSDNLLLIGILVVGLIPIVLVLIDALIRRGGTLSFQGVAINLAAAASPAVDFRIDTNIGAEGETVTDSSSLQILDALTRAAESDIVVVDLEDGKAWWETRLLILVAGAARKGRPRSVVFVESTQQQKRAFLGWAPPQAILNALLDERNPRHVTYLKAYALAQEAGAKWQKQIDLLGQNPPAGSAPAPPPDLTAVPPNWLWGSWVAWDGSRANPFATEQFLALALGNEVEEKWKAVPFPADPAASSAEKFPHAITVTEEMLNAQFADKLHRVAIEETATSDEQVEASLKETGEFAAITRKGSYVRSAPRSVVMEGLVQQLLISSWADRGSSR